MSNQDHIDNEYCKSCDKYLKVNDGKSKSIDNDLKINQDDNEIQVDQSTQNDQSIYNDPSELTEICFSFNTTGSFVIS